MRLSSIDEDPRDGRSSAGGFNSGNGDIGLVVLLFAEFNDAIGQCEEGEIPADTDVLTGMVGGTTLADDDVSGDGGLSAEDLHAKTLALGVASVLYTAFTFFVCHDYGI